MSEYIKASNVLMEELSCRFGIDFRAVRRALRFHTNGSISRAVRAHALNHGGKLFREERISHVSSDYRMATVIMRFGSGVTVRLDSFENTAVLSVEDVGVVVLEDCNISSFASLCARAQSIADQRYQDKHQ